MLDSAAYPTSFSQPICNAWSKWELLSRYPSSSIINLSRIRNRELSWLISRKANRPKAESNSSCCSIGMENCCCFHLYIYLRYRPYNPALVLGKLPSLSFCQILHNINNRRGFFTKSCKRLLLARFNFAFNRFPFSRSDSNHLSINANTCRG